ncbi:MAG: TerB family tellurite resistance protein [Gammaproteobacteria bacterium]|nr:MAG: TerB family tellurite resistance protein [Gammaproteobacteria bacterium]
MLSKISAFFERHLQPAGDVSAALSHSQKQLAIAALLIEVAMADHVFSEGEMLSLQHHLKQKFTITDAQLAELIDLARDESAEATSIHQFTSLIHQHCTPQEKFELLVSMWELAFADLELSKYEEYVIRKVADLIYVSHAEFVRAKSIAKSKTHT